MAKPGSIAETLAAQQAQSRLLAPIPTTPPKSIAVGTRELKRIIVGNLGSGGVNPVVCAGDFLFVEQFRVTSANGGLIATTDNNSPITVRSDSGLVSTPIFSEGSRIDFPTPFNFLEFTNPAVNVPVFLVVWVGFGGYDNLTRIGSISRSVTQSVLVQSAVQYAVNDCVGAGVNVLRGVFLPGFNFAEITRAKLTINRNVATAANFALMLWNGDANAQAFVDHTQFSLPFALAGAQQPMLIFPWFASAGAGGDEVFCELTDFSVVLTKSLTEFFENAVCWQLVANDLYTPANPTSFRLDITSRVF